MSSFDLKALKPNNIGTISQRKQNMKKKFELVTRLARGKAVFAAIFAGLFAAVSAQAQGGYTIQIGQGTSPFVDDLPSTSYTVDATGIQSNQGVHGFVTHHNGVDTYVNMPGENYYIDHLHIDNSGQVSGTYNANYGGYGCTSFYWDGQLNLFPALYGTGDPHVSDMNDYGVVVGSVQSYGARQGFIYDHGGYYLFNLSTYQPTFAYNGTTYNMHGQYVLVDRINDLGQISGGFSLQNGMGPNFWFIASPVGMIPEPGSMTLLGLGFASWLITKRKRTNRG
jgi:PEP-CTERM motif